MKVKFMDGPKAGEVLEVPHGHRISIPSFRDGVAVYTNPEEPIPKAAFEVTEYVILRLNRHVYSNEHLQIIDTARLAYSGPLPEIPPDEAPRGPLPFERKVMACPEPDFLTDFDAWWRRKLWDFKVTQDRETKYEIERLEDELEYNRL